MNKKANSPVFEIALMALLALVLITIGYAGPGDYSTQLDQQLATQLPASELEAQPDSQLALIEDSFQRGFEYRQQTNISARAYTQQEQTTEGKDLLPKATTSNELILNSFGRIM